MSTLKEMELNQNAPLEESSEKLPDQEISGTEAKDTSPSEKHEEEQTNLSSERDELGTEDQEAWEEDEHAESVEHEESASEDFASLSKASLLEKLKEVTAAENPMEVNKTVQEIKKYFELQVEKEYKKALDRFIEEGNSEIDFKPKPDPVKDEFFDIFKNFKKKRSAFIEALNQEKEENLAKKRKILDQMKEITEDAEMKGRLKAFKQLQNDWKKIGHVPKHELENLWRSYDFYVKKFYDNLHLYSEFRELDRKKNLESKQELCAKLEALTQVNELKELDQKLRKIQNEWHQIGPVPDDDHETLINRFNQAIANAEAHKESLENAIREEQQKNLEAKQAIIDQIRSFQNFASEKPKDWVDKNNELEGLVKQWKSIGHVPYEQKDQVAKAFKEAIREFNHQKNQFFKRKKQERAQILNRKAEILEEAKALLESEDFRKAKGVLLDLQKEWKQLGIVPSKKGEEMWEEFRKVCDEFFNKLDNYNDQKKEEEQENLKAKEALCEKAEKHMEEGPEDPETLVKDLQSEWEQIGFVPYDHKDKIRDRFNKALEGILKASEGRIQTDPELLTYKIKIDGLREQGKNSQLKAEEKKLSKQLKQNEDEIGQLEQNMQFFNSSSSNAQKLLDEYQQKIETLKNEASKIQEKLDLINQE